MPIDLVSLALAALAPRALDLVEGLAKSRAPEGIPPARATQFTRVVGGARHLNEDICRGLPRWLAMRSAEPAPSRRPGTQAWRVVPRRKDLLGAEEVVENARRAGHVVLASLSIVLLPEAIGSGRDPLPMLLASVPRGMAERLCGPRAQLAILDPPPVVTPPPEPPAAAAEQPASESKPRNGKAASAA